MKYAPNWIFFVAKRFAHVDTQGRTAFTSFLSALGIAFGVMTLIVIISVMNGFQMGYIESILEVSSYHVRITDTNKAIDPSEVMSKIKQPEITAVIPFMEAQILLGGKNVSQTGALLRAVPADICDQDVSFKDAVHITSGTFDVETPFSIVLGSELARSLSTRVGDSVNLFAVSGGADTELFAADRKYIVSGIFKTGYYEIDASFAFISEQAGYALFGDSAELTYGIKLRNYNNDAQAYSALQTLLPSAHIESWRSFNRSFFGALRVEKNMLFLLVFLIFIVVAVNIFNSMRRTVYERREEISVLSALGAEQRVIQWIFISNGFFIGAGGAFSGLLLGLLISVQINEIFMLIESLVNEVLSFISLLISPSYLAGAQGNFSLFSPVYFYITEISARVIFAEVVFITLFGVLSAVTASWIASKGILRITPAEVLRDE